MSSHGAGGRPAQMQAQAQAAAVTCFASWIITRDLMLKAALNCSMVAFIAKFLQPAG